MKKYFAPLGVFVGGMIVSLVFYLFLGTIGDEATELQTQSAPMASTFWGWSWVSSPTTVQFLIFIGLMLLTLYATFRAFLAVR